MTTQNTSNNDKSTSSPSMQKRGCKGGETTAQTHGSDFYSEIGKKGGQSNSNQSSNDSDRDIDMSSKDNKSNSLNS